MRMKIHVKKIAVDVDNSPNYSEKRYQMICQIQGFLKEGCSYREIVRRMGVGRNTIAKYRNGNPMELSMYGVRRHIVVGANRILFSVYQPTRLCRIGTYRRF